MLNRIKFVWRRFLYKRALSSRSIENRFSNIYKSNLWFGNLESRSGAGSTLQATSSVRQNLPSLLRNLQASNLVDIGCGDFYWMKEVDLPCDYIGLDIVKDLINENMRKYQSPNRRFLHSNAIEEPLPSKSDVVLCREVLFHLSFEDGQKLVRNVINSNARYFIVTTDETVENNKDIKTGSFRNVNLTLPPYNFPSKHASIEDAGVSSTRLLAVWKIEHLRIHLGQSVNYSRCNGE